MSNHYKRGDIWNVNFGNGKGSEQAGLRPAVIIQNDVGNQFSPTLIVAAITDGNKKDLPTHVKLDSIYGLTKDSVVMLEQIRTIDKGRLKNRIAYLPESFMKKVDNALMISAGLVPQKVKDHTRPAKGGNHTNY